MSDSNKTGLFNKLLTGMRRHSIAASKTGPGSPSSSSAGISDQLERKPSLVQTIKRRTSDMLDASSFKSSQSSTKRRSQLSNGSQQPSRTSLWVKYHFKNLIGAIDKHMIFRITPAFNVEESQSSNDVLSQPISPSGSYIYGEVRSGRSIFSETGEIILEGLEELIDLDCPP